MGSGAFFVVEGPSAWACGKLVSNTPWIIVCDFSSISDSVIMLHKGEPIGLAIFVAEVPPGEISTTLG